MASRQLILVKPAQGASESMSPLGTRRQVAEALAAFNCAPDGSGPEGMGQAPGVGTFHGPGFVAEMQSGAEEVSQLLVTLTDDDFGWPPLMRLCRANGWAMMDPESGRMFGAAAHE